jgi:hypothetical protein
MMTFFSSLGGVEGATDSTTVSSATSAGVPSTVVAGSAGVWAVPDSAWVVVGCLLTCAVSVRARYERGATHFIRQGLDTGRSCHIYILWCLDMGLLDLGLDRSGGLGTSLDGGLGDKGGLHAVDKVVDVHGVGVICVVIKVE